MAKNKKEPKRPLRVVVRFVEKEMTPERRAAGDRLFTSLLQRYRVTDDGEVVDAEGGGKSAD